MPHPPHNGIARAYCEACDHDFLVAFSCKVRGVCPSCTAKRMRLTATHLTCSVIPPVPVRQWVLSVPKRLRYFLAQHGEFLNKTVSCWHFLDLLPEGAGNWSPRLEYPDS